jgi:hypothetical protein
MTDAFQRTRRLSAEVPWPIEELVRAQCMAWHGASCEAIAQGCEKKVAR